MQVPVFGLSRSHWSATANRPRPLLLEARAAHQHCRLLTYHATVHLSTLLLLHFLPRSSPSTLTRLSQHRDGKYPAFSRIHLSELHPLTSLQANVIANSGHDDMIVRTRLHLTLSSKTHGTIALVNRNPAHHMRNGCSQRRFAVYGS